jgi:hypothetical protein
MNAYNRSFFVIWWNLTIPLFLKFTPSKGIINNAAFRCCGSNLLLIFIFIDISLVLSSIMSAYQLSLIIIL